MEKLREAGKFIRAAQAAFTEGGYEVQTVRLATIPFPELLREVELQSALELATTLEAAAKENGFGYISLGPALPDRLESYGLIPEMLKATQSVFFSGAMTETQRGVSLAAVKACAQVMHAAAPLEPNGFANLRFAALASVPPGAPFFPAAYHAGDVPQFAIATEAADLAVKAFSSAKSLDQGVRTLVGEIESNGRRLGGIADRLVTQFGVAFGGVDFSLAQFPEEQLSLGTALERVGAPRVGLYGSLTAAAILTDAIDRAKFPRAGFNGLFMPLLEDFTLAARAAEGILGVKDLLLYSAVCGTGLDTVPLPGDTSVEALSAVLLDLAALSTRLGKPLTARLMPIPGKKAGDETSFDFDFFANSRVLTLEAEPLAGHLSGDEWFNLRKRREG
jgi:hypothetical protein